ncbi:MAG: protein-tyrosine phosphatase [Solirubrobacteraceae bacterium]|nr:protein-tyrosine phosphatase [Solirubrobacteraceae bacterium]
MSYVDLHRHLLPGIDDGPPDDQASLEYAAALFAAGIREATVTPHVAHARFPLDIATIGDRTALLQEQLRRAGIGIALHPGGEIHPSGAADLSEHELDTIAHGPRNARWVLLEVPFGGISRLFLDACEQIRGHGFGLVIAHPERASGLLEGGLARLRSEMAAGAVLQVSVCSLIGRHGHEAQLAGEYLVRTGLAYVIASDGHGGARAQSLAEGVAPARAAGASAVQAWQLTQANPAFLLRHGIAPEPSRTRGAWSARTHRNLNAAREAARRLGGIHVGT